MAEHLEVAREIDREAPSAGYFVSIVHVWIGDAAATFTGAEKTEALARKLGEPSPSRPSRAGGMGPGQLRAAPRSSRLHALSRHLRILSVPGERLLLAQEADVL